MAIDDALEETPSPKVDDCTEYLVFNYTTLSEQDDWDPYIDELAVFLGKSYLVTHHDLPVDFLDEVWDSRQRDPRRTQEGTYHVLYLVIDHLVTHYMPILERLDLPLDQIEDTFLDRPSNYTLQRFFTLKRLLLTMRRITLPQRDVLNKLARDDYKVIDPRNYIFFRDIYAI